MGTRGGRRAIVVAILVAVVSALAWAWYHVGTERTPEERARKTAEQLKERARQQLTR
ncbi:MAG TPA: hypothetical protein VIW03_14220 [Anaeromyxobacter sp.]